jgi:hypothetical protein
VHQRLTLIEEEGTHIAARVVWVEEVRVSCVYARRIPEQAVVSMLGKYKERIGVQINCLQNSEGSRSCRFPGFLPAFKSGTCSSGNL